ncbi:toxin-antitoxin system HicB family antitoxin [Pseudomonas sp. W22_MBD1_FP4]|uniref:toxin-antitoxin system HicB family antitoxin n=1 Tax=Pseudomonas sp. W22_MBD1_FP4 TaxID=3240272 RepID=UPI003F9C57F4
MKSDGLHPFLARIPPDLHAAIKSTARAHALSMNVFVLSLLSDSLKLYPVIEMMPVIQLTQAKPFCVRTPAELHEQLLHAAFCADPERSLNLEVLGRILVMTSPSKQNVLNAWSVLNELNSTMDTLIKACPGAQLEALANLRTALDSLERQITNSSD